MAAAIKEANGVACELVKSKGGVFDVEVDGKLIFSKHEAMRFPTNEEILNLL